MATNKLHLSNGYHFRKACNNIFSILFSASPDTLCREKWANLRSNYMRETRKLRIRRIEGKPLKVTWPYFHLLEFLNPAFHK